MSHPAVHTSVTAKYAAIHQRLVPRKDRIQGNRIRGHDAALPVVRPGRHQPHAVDGRFRPERKGNADHRDQRVHDGYAAVASSGVPVRASAQTGRQQTAHRERGKAEPGIEPCHRIRRVGDHLLPRALHAVEIARREVARHDRQHGGDHDGRGNRQLDQHARPRPHVEDQLEARHDHHDRREEIEEVPVRQPGQQEGGGEAGEGGAAARGEVAMERPQADRHPAVHQRLQVSRFLGAERHEDEQHAGHGVRCECLVSH